MNKPTRPLRRTDKASMLDDQIDQALSFMLENDDDIGHRAVMRKVSGISAVSSITRDEYRRSLVEYYSSIQAERNKWAKRSQKTSQEKISAQLALKDHRIQDLEREISILTASHKALLLAVGETGGVAAWLRFFDGYQEIVDRISREKSLLKSVL